MLIIDFSDYGPVPPRGIAQEQLDQFASEAESIIEEYSAEFIEDWVRDWELSLAWESVSGSATAEWYARAMLLIAVQGLRGIRVPKTHTISPW